MAGHGDTTQLRELLYRAEAERLHLQQKTTLLDETNQQLSTDVQKQQQQLADAHAAYVGSQQQVQQLSATNNLLQLQAEAATREYRANDIIAVGLRDQITRLQRQLDGKQELCKQQASQIATWADDLAALRQDRAELSQQLSNLHQQHAQLQAGYEQAQQQLKVASQELQETKQQWIDQHGGIARQMQEVQQGKQQLQAALGGLQKQVQDLQQQLKEEHGRCVEYEAEVTTVRDVVMVLGKAIGRQPKGKELPSHGDPIWSVMGPCGGVQHALEVAMKHVRAQDSKLKGLQSEVDRLEDRVRSESAQKAELQSGLFDVRGLYAKAVADRESLEARTARAEAEKAAAEVNWQRAMTQAEEDSRGLSEAQQSVMSLTQQVQQLLPLQPRCATLELDRDTLQHRLDSLKEQHDQLECQLQQMTARRNELQASLDIYKAEHGQLLSANAQLVEQCQTLDRRVQELEISIREGSIATGQLEEARRKLKSTQSQLEAVTETNQKTLRRSEQAESMYRVLLEEVGGLPRREHGSQPGSSGPSFRRPGSSQPNSRPSTAGTAATAVDNTSPRQGDSGAAVSPPPNMDASPQSPSSSKGPGRRMCMPISHHNCTDDLREASSSTTASTRSLRPRTSIAEEDELSSVAEELAQLPPDIVALLRAKGLEQQQTQKQKKWHEIKVSVLGWLTGQLRKKLQQQMELCAQLQVQLVQQEVQHLQVLKQQEAVISQQCMAVAEHATAAMQQALSALQEAMCILAKGEVVPPHPSSSSDNSSTACVLQEKPAAEELQQRFKWLHQTVSHLTTGLQGVAAEASARADLIAARCDIGVQSDAPLQAEWLRFIKALPYGAITHTLSTKAVAEVIVRIYIRGLHQVEAGWGHQQQQQGQTVLRRPASASKLAGSAGGADAEPTNTLFDVMMAHYTQQQQGQQDGVLTYNAALWNDPQGPIPRLLVSCRQLASSSTKAGLFCCFAGTHTSRSLAWGVEHWQQFLLLLHATKQLVGGLWNEVLRDWAMVTGASLPLQCAQDLLGNVYNVSDISALDRLPAILGTKQLLLSASTQPASQAKHAAVADSSDSSGAAQNSNGVAAAAAAGGSRPASNSAASILYHGSVAAVLQQLVVDGAIGPAVDLDDFLAMLMQQYDAGLLPSHPLLAPRRLMSGSLANQGNAWGVGTAEPSGIVGAGGSSSSNSSRRYTGSQGVLGTDGMDGTSLASEAYQPSSLSYNSSAWPSRSTSGSRGSTGAAAGEFASPAAPGVLPRIWTPDSASVGTKAGSGHSPRGAENAGLKQQAVSSQQQPAPLPAVPSQRKPTGQVVTIATELLQTGSDSNSSSARRGFSPILKGTGSGPSSPVLSARNVAFKDAPDAAASSRACDNNAAPSRLSHSVSTRGRF